MGCSSLTSTTLPNSLTYIAEDAFTGCENLTEIAIPNSVTSIGDGAFSCCYSLASVEIPNSVQTIGRAAFFNCGLTSITIPSSVVFMEANAISTSPRLTSVTAKRPKPISIEENTFEYRTYATLYVSKGSKTAYESAYYWKDFKEIIEYEGLLGDVNGDDEVDEKDKKAIICHIMGKTPDNFSEYAADINKDDKVNIADVVTLINKE